MSWRSAYTNALVLAMVVLAARFGALLLAENEEPFGGAGLYLRDGLNGDVTGFMSSSSQTKGLKHVIRGRFDVRVDVSLRMTTPTFLN